MNAFLTSFWKSIEKSWQAGAPTPLPSPSVGRGLFSNPFLTERDRDLCDVRTLYDRVGEAQERSIFAGEGVLDTALLETFRKACRESSVDTFGWAVDIGYEPARELLEREFLAFPALLNADWSRLTLRDVSELRTLLLRKDTQLRHARETSRVAPSAFF